MVQRGAGEWPGSMLAGVLYGVFHRSPLRWRGALAATWREAPRHPSPNAGWPEAMVANLLGVQLGGTNVYQGQVSHRATLGTAHDLLKASHITTTIWLMHGAWLLFFLLMFFLLLFLQLCLVMATGAG